MKKSSVFQTLAAAGLAIALPVSAASAYAAFQQDNNQNNNESMQQAQASGMPSFDELAEKAVESIGGREALNEVKTLHTVMSMEVMGSEITMENMWQREGGRISKSKTPMGDTEMGTDGTTAWMLVPDPAGDGRYMLIEGVQAQQVDSQSSLHMNMLDPKLIEDNMESLEVVGQEEFDGQMAYKVRFMPKDESGEGFFFYDVESGRPLGLRQTVTNQMGEQTTTITLGQWKEVQGVDFFHMLEVESPSMPGGPVEMKVDKLEVNKLEASMFDLPEQVKQLVAEREEADQNEPDGENTADGGEAEEIKLEDLPAVYREQAQTVIEQTKAGGEQTVRQALENMQQVLDALPEGDDRKALRYIMQELKKGN